MPPRRRIFLDANVIFAGLYSTRGAPNAILKAHIDGLVAAVVSRQVIEETVANIRNKQPHLVPILYFLLQNAPFEIQPDPTADEVQRWAGIIHPTDAPVLAAAIAAQPDALVTGNTRHFTPEVAKKAHLRILTPAQFVEEILS